MTQFLQQSACRTIWLGPFVDNADGYTPETSLTIDASKIRLAKNSTNFAAKNSTGNASHIEFGWYAVPINDTDTGTVGRLVVAASVTGALPVWRSFMVLPSNVHLSLVDGSDSLQVHTVELNASLFSASNFAASALTENIITASVGKLFADEWSDRNVAGSSTGGRRNKEALYALRNKVVISSSVMTVYQTDDAASSWTAAVTTASGNPISTIDPA